MYKTSDDTRFIHNRSMLQRAFIELVKEKRSAKISVKELTDRAQVNRMTFYSHYEEVTDILLEITDGMTEEILAGQEGRDAFDIEALLEDSNKTMQSEIEFFRVAAETDDLGLFRNGFRAAFKRIFEEELERSSELSGVQLELAASTMASGVSYAYFDWLAGEFGDISKEELGAYLKHYVQVLSR